jgi:aminopeptidase N
VLRDQQFSADMGSAPVKRIEDVRVLRAAQFPEDSGPLAHPIRPDAYQEISNFYTATVYNKGAEVIRMMTVLAGPERFRSGTDLYFDRHDGEAATCEDFVRRDRGRRGPRPQAVPPLVRAGRHPARDRHAGPRG